MSLGYLQIQILKLYFENLSRMYFFFISSKLKMILGYIVGTCDKVIFWVEITYFDYTIVKLGKFNEFEDIPIVFGLYFRSYNSASLSQVIITLRIFF